MAMTDRHEIARDEPRPALSVVMAAHDAQVHIGAAIESLLAQTFTDFELIVVDDGSSDGTAQIVASIDDPRIRLVRLDRRVGPAAARNHALQLARSDLVAILDADDIAYPTRLERQLAYLEEHPDCALLGTAFDRIAADGAQTRRADPPTEPLLLRWSLLTGNPIAHSTVMMRREAVLEAGGYREDLRYGEDYALWVALAPRTELAQLPEVLVAYRESPHGLSATRTLAASHEAIEIVREAFAQVTGSPPSWSAAACLRGLSEGEPLRPSCIEAGRALGDALLCMTAGHPRPDRLSTLMLVDWRRRVIGLCRLSPTALPAILALSAQLTWKTAGIVGFDRAYVAWLRRCVMLTAKSTVRRHLAPGAAGRSGSHLDN
jgi:hypothetical protein